MSSVELKLDKDIIRVTLKQGDTQRYQIIIKNNGNTDLSEIKVDLGNIKDHVMIDYDSFSLAKGEAKTLNLDFYAATNEISEIDTGRITFSGNEITRTVNTIIEIKEKQPLFDVQLDVINEIVSPESNISANITILNFGDLKNIDILLYLAIKDFDGNTLMFKEESLAIQDKLALTRGFNLNNQFPAGDYVFYASASYNQINASSADSFKIMQILERHVSSLYYYLIMPLIILVTFVLWYIINRKFSDKIRYKR